MLLGRESVSRAVYGSIVTLAVLLVIERDPPTAWSAAGMLFGTALAVALAETFSKTVAEIIAGEERLDARSLGAIWRETRPVLIAANLPTLVLASSALGLCSMSVALCAAKILVYSALFLFGLRVGQVRHGTCLRMVISGLFTAGIGGLIGLVKMLCH